MVGVLIPHNNLYFNERKDENKCLPHYFDISDWIRIQLCSAGAPVVLPIADISHNHTAGDGVLFSIENAQSFLQINALFVVFWWCTKMDKYLVWP